MQTIYIDPPFNTGKDFDYVDGYQDSTWLTLMENRLLLARDLLKDSGSLFLHLDYRANYIGRILLDRIFRGNFVNEVIYGYRIQGINRSGLPNKHDTIFLYAKNLSNHLFKPIKETIQYKKPFIDTKVDIPYINLTDREKEILCNHIRKNEVLPDKYREILFRKYYSEVFVRDVWDNDETKPLISGSSEYLNFRTQKSEGLLKRILVITSNEGDFVVDFFLGSGTTTAVAHKLRRKWIGIEMGEHFYTVDLPRMKKVLFYDKSGISKDKDVKEHYNKDKAGGFFKYYELEQFADILEHMHYDEKFATELVTYLHKDIQTSPDTKGSQWKKLVNGQYKFATNKNIFVYDSKLIPAINSNKNIIAWTSSESTQSDKENATVEFLKGGDMVETISNLTGWKIKRITKERAEFITNTGDIKTITLPIDEQIFRELQIKRLFHW